MDFSFDLKNRTGGRRAVGSPGVPGHPDWHALQARLVAAWQLNRARTADLTTIPEDPQGSFAPSAARLIAPARAAAAGVNPNDLANRKPACSTVAAGAEAQVLAGEG